MASSSYIGALGQFGRGILYGGEQTLGALDNTRFGKWFNRSAYGPAGAAKAQADYNSLMERDKPTNLNGALGLGTEKLAEAVGGLAAGGAGETAESVPELLLRSGYGMAAPTTLGPYVRHLATRMAPPLQRAGSAVGQAANRFTNFTPLALASLSSVAASRLPKSGYTIAAPALVGNPRPPASR